MRLLRLFKRDLAHEAQEWIARGIVERDQAEKILALYGTALHDPTIRARGYWVLIAIAVLFAGGALYLAVSANWEQLPRPLRTLGLMLLTLCLVLAGFWHRTRQQYRFANIWFFAAALAYGSAILLIERIYQLGVHLSDSLYYWALGILPFVLFTHSRLLALLMLILATFWLSLASRMQLFPASFPLFLLACAWLLRYRHSPSLLLSLLVGAISWFNLLLAWLLGGGGHYQPAVDQLPLNIALGTLLSGCAWWLVRREDSDSKDYGLVLHTWLLRTLILLLLVLSFEQSWQLLREHGIEYGWLGPTAILLLGPLGLYLGFASGRRAWIPISSHIIFFSLVFALLAQSAVPLWLPAVLTNLMLVLLGVWLIYRGIGDGISHYFYSGVVVLLLTGLLRYFDLIGEQNGGALLFTAAATILFFAARFWQRRALTGALHDDSA